MTVLRHIAEQEIFAHRLRNCASLEEAWSVLDKFLKKNGFSDSLYAFIPLPPRQPHTQQWILMDSYPETYSSQYLAAGIAEYDPTVKHCKLHTQPLRWNSPELLNGLSAEELAVEKFTWDFGMLEGLTLPLVCPRNLGRGGIGLNAMNRSKIDLNQQLKSDGDHIFRIIEMFHLYALSNGFFNYFNITPRQHEVLRYLALGYFNDEIAHHLHIATSTVEKHLQQIRFRLRASSNEQAVAKAMVCNLIRL